jgi:ElaB/YqjD/DUF883 family membrane-anchored ribosome-binding protein
MAEVHNTNQPRPQQPGHDRGVGDAFRQAASTVEDAASAVAQRVENAWESASSGVRQGAQAVAGTAEDFWEGTTGLIRRHPVASVLIAFGVGCLAASLFTLPQLRRSDDVGRRMSRASA